MRKEQRISMSVVIAFIAMICCGGGAVTTLYGCNGCSPDTPDTIKDTVTQMPPPKPTATLLFDISGSMKGYLKSADDSRFNGVVSAFEDLYPKTKICLFGKSNCTAVEKGIFDKILNTGNSPNDSIKLWKDETNLIQMVDTMKRCIKQGDDVCFLVTDGILSGSHEDIVNSPNRSYNKKMREAMMKKIEGVLKDTLSSPLSVLLVRYYASFDGNYFNYKDECVKNLSVSNRPFFVIVMGNYEIVKDIEAGLQQIKSGSLRNRLATPYENVLMIANATSLSEAIQLRIAKGLEYDNGSYRWKTGKDATVVLTANLDNLPSSMQDSLYIVNNSSLGKRYSKTEDYTYLKKGIDYEIVVEGKKMTVKIKNLKGINNIESLVYRLKYEEPQWVRDTSDDDDEKIKADGTKQEKTFNLEYFVAGFYGLIGDGSYVKEQTFKFKK